MRYATDNSSVVGTIPKSLCAITVAMETTPDITKNGSFSLTNRHIATHLLPIFPSPTQRRNGQKSKTNIKAGKVTAIGLLIKAQAKQTKTTTYLFHDRLFT